MSALTAEHAAALRKGHKLHIQAKRRQGIARVRAYQAWCASGQPMSTIPEVPSAGDYKAARRVGR